MRKQFYLTYETDKVVCGSNEHFYGNASSIKTAQAYISRIRKEYASENPKNFKIFDCWTDCGEPAKLVYEEA